MAWQDFERERKWKLSQAKKAAMRAIRSKLDVVAKENRRLKVGGRDGLSCWRASLWVLGRVCNDYVT